MSWLSFVRMAAFVDEGGAAVEGEEEEEEEEVPVLEKREGIIYCGGKGMV